MHHWHAPCTAAAAALLQAFLQANVEVVDPGVTASLLASYGRMDDLMHFASYRKVRPQGNCDTEPQCWSS
jgi:hypothetical protein